MGASFVNNTEILHFRVQFPAYSDRAVQNSSSNGGLTRTSTNHLMDDITPLRDMADRVGREVEHFAETLDRYNDRLRSEDSFDAAYELAMEYKAFAQDMVNKLKKKHETQRIREVKRDTSKRVQSSPDFGSTRRDVNGAAEGQNGERDTNVETLKHWQAEADTWELFRIMLQLRYNPNQQEMQRQKEEQLEALRTPHRYTPENEIWDRFMLENDAAKERYLVLKWLEESANHGDNDVDAIVEELENKSGTKGLWYNGWMETRERIKGDKRLGRTNTKRSDNNEPLVSNLDPDAPTRQKRSLEKADAFSERALWMICWEMLRRGKSWGEICDWCLERNQSWRAVSVGKAADGDLAVGMPGQSLGGLWRRICYATAKDGTTDEYEAAVYGLLSGDLDTVLAVCKTWDDHFYAHYNSLLLSQFDQYLQQVSPPRISPTLNKRFGLFNAVQHHGDSRSAGRNLVKRLKQQGSTAKQAQQATKLLQGSLIADTVEDLFANVGTAISDAAWLDGTSPVITPIRTAVAPGSSDFLAENSIVQDYDALRVATHILIILREFHITPSQRSAEADVLDNVIAAYIGILQAGGKRDNTLIYASKMAPKRAVASLAQVLGDVNDPREQRELITLMEQYGISPIEVLIEQYRSLVKDTLAERSAEEATLRVVEDTDEDIYPGKRIRRGFTDQTVGEAEQSIVAALMAFWVVDGQWRVTFEAAAFVLRKFLVNGYFAGARELVRKLDAEQLSRIKSPAYLGASLDVFNEQELNTYFTSVDEAERDELLAKVSLLRKQASPYTELTFLVDALEALEDWRQAEYQHVNKPARPSSASQDLRAAFENVQACMSPLLQGVLMDSADESQQAELLRIRTLYLPSIVIAYLAVLVSAGHMLSRDALLDAMDLSTVVADEKRGLSQAFVNAGRMKELVTCLAETSKIMLKLGESGKKSKRERAGRSLGIWEIHG